MNFDFSDDQRRLQDEIRKVLTEHSTSDAVRVVLDGNATYDQDTWQQLAQLGALGLAIPEEHDGTGLGALELCLLAEECGRALVAAPLLSTIYQAAEVIKRAGSEDQQQKFLSAIATGTCIMTCQLEQPVEFAAEPISLGFTSEDRSSIAGVAEALPDAIAASHAILMVDGCLVLVDLSQASVTRSLQTSIDGTRPLGKLRFQSAPCELLAGDANHEAIAQRVINGAAVLLAFEQVGGAEAALYAARDYTLERKTFGRAVGSYQAVKHTLADLFSAIEIARAHAWYGAWAMSTDADELPRAAAAARVAASEAYNRVAEESLHLHGGIGFTWEMDCHLHLRRARWLAQILGSRQLWRNKLATALIEEAA